MLARVWGRRRGAGGAPALGVAPRIARDVVLSSPRAAPGAGRHRIRDPAPPPAFRRRRGARGIREAAAEPASDRGALGRGAPHLARAARRAGGDEGLPGGRQAGERHGERGAALLGGGGAAAPRRARPEAGGGGGEAAAVGVAAARSLVRRSCSRSCCCCCWCCCCCCCCSSSGSCSCCRAESGRVAGSGGCRRRCAAAAPSSHSPSSKLACTSRRGRACWTATRGSSARRRAAGL